MRDITRKMYKMYGMKDFDWMGYEIYSVDLLDAHHIKKRADGGKYTLDNVAVLNNYNHRYLHIVEQKDLDLYVYLNILLKKVNESGRMPSIQTLLAINAILEQFEREHCSDTNQKGEPLIKEQYTKRLVRRIW